MRDEPVHQVAVHWCVASRTAGRVSLALPHRRDLDAEALVQTTVDIDLRPLLDVTADENHRDLVALGKRHDHPPVPAEVDDAQALDLITLQVGSRRLRNRDAPGDP
jgi:hypothetical protein